MIKPKNLRQFHAKLVEAYPWQPEYGEFGGCHNLPSHASLKEGIAYSNEDGTQVTFCVDFKASRGASIMKVEEDAIETGPSWTGPVRTFLDWVAAEIGAAPLDWEVAR